MVYVLFHSYLFILLGLIVKNLFTTIENVPLTDVLFSNLSRKQKGWSGGSVCELTKHR